MLVGTIGAAQYLGISKRSMERLVEREDIEVVRLPGIRRNLFRVEDLDKLIKEARIVPAYVPGSGHGLAVIGGTRRSR